MTRSFGTLAGLWMIVRRSLRQHALSSAITVVSVALASGLVMATFSVNQQTQEAFTGGEVGFDAVLGARGSQLQLVLNTIFHLETSPGNIPWALYQEMKKDRRVSLAIPYAVGDNWQGYRIVGTTEELFTEFEYRKGKKFTLQPGGIFFDPKRREAVIGSTVALRSGLRVGDAIYPYHGVIFDERARHESRYQVVGVLEATNSPSDQVVWIPLEGVFRMGGHVLRGSDEVYEAEPGEAIPDEHKEVSAVLLKFRNLQTGMQLAQTINNQGNVATLAFPIGQVMRELFDKMGWVNRVLEMVAYLVILVAAGSILASIYNAMNERRREFAILRALGARRRTVFAAIVLESTTIAMLGSLAGFLVYGGILGLATQVIRQQTGVVLEVYTFHPCFVGTPLLLMVLGALAGLLPAVKAYATDVADHLVATS